MDEVSRNQGMERFVPFLDIFMLSDHDTKGKADKHNNDKVEEEIFLVSRHRHNEV